MSFPAHGRSRRCSGNARDDDTWPARWQSVEVLRRGHSRWRSGLRGGIDGDDRRLGSYDAMTSRGGTQIHPSAVVEAGAQIGEGCTIGPFCHIGPDVVLGEGCAIKSHVVITGDTTLGAG